MTSVEMRNIVIEFLNGYLALPVCLSNQVQPEPDYPYVYYTLVNASIPSGSLGDVSLGNVASFEPEFDVDVINYRSDLVKAVFSFSTVSRNRETEVGCIYGDDEAMELAEKAAGYFTHVGEEELSLMGVTVVEVGNVFDRSEVIIDETERRYGFEVTIRYEQVERRNDRSVEHINLRKG